MSRFTPTRTHTREGKNRLGRRENDPSTHILKHPIIQRLWNDNKPKEAGVITHPIPDKNLRNRGKNKGEGRERTKNKTA